MADYSMIMMDEKSLALQGFCPGYPGGAASSAAAAPAAPAAGGGAGDDINAQIAAKGNEIRELKAKKATKDEIMPLVGQLNDLKAQFLAATGKKWEPAGGGSSGGSKKKKSKGGEDKAAKDAPLTAEQQGNFDLLRSVGEECVTEDDLKTLLKQKPAFNLYDGFEPSGRMHIAQGVFKAMNVNKCTKAGGTFYFWVADWFALMNDKMGGDLEKIKVVGQYLIEVWKASGMDMDKVVFRWAAEDITKEAATYWPKMLDIARRFNITRIKKCCQIMGRLEGNLTAAQILYPLMQCTDVFFLKADICQLGVDQRKVNMLAREYCDAAKVKLKPVILSHHMLYGLKAGQEKMSKSDPDSAIFMEDTVEDVNRKITNAYCPSKPAEDAAKKAAAATDDAGKESMHLVEDDLKNPCLDYIQHIILCPPGATFSAGGKTYKEFAPIKADFVAGKLSEDVLKAGLIKAVNKLLEPVRKHFSQGEPQRLLAQVKEWKKQNLKPSGEIRRLAYPDASKGAVFAVFAPMPTTPKTTLGSTLSIVRQLKAAPMGSQVFLWLSDWSAFTLNCLDADPKLIRASFTMLVEALKAIDADLMKSVQVVWQSEAILTDPSNYWISVINVGRKFQLETVRAVDQANEQVGQVISSLMHVGDVLGLGAATIAGSEGQELLHKLPEQYYKLAGVGADIVPTPDVVVVPSVATELKQPVTPGVVADDANIFLVDDPKVGVAKRIKKAFCEPENVDYNPPLSIAQELGIAMNGSFVVERKPENGGNSTYTDSASLIADFKSGAIHPGDLKPCVSKLVVSYLEKIIAQFKSNKETVAADKAIKAYIKKLSKKR